MREVENASLRIAARRSNDEFAIAPSRISDIETKGVVPSIYRLYTLAVIYRLDVREILGWYGIELNQLAEDLALGLPPKSHRAEALPATTNIRIPIRFDPSFDSRRTANLGRIVEQWGTVPLAYLEQFSHDNFTYAYIGSEDLTMYPLLPPGTFLQVDETRNRVLQ